MDLTNFALWKFRFIEGYLQNMQSYDVTTTKYVNPKDLAVTWIRYDMDKEKARIESGDRVVECRFDELEKTLKDLGLYRERLYADMHHLAGPQKVEEVK